MVDVGPFGVLEIVGLVVSLLGLLPVLSQHRDETKWFTAGYLLLVFGMFSTTAEDVILPVVLNFGEHFVGIGVAGLVFMYAAYRRRQEITLKSGGVE